MPRSLLSLAKSKPIKTHALRSFFCAAALLASATSHAAGEALERPEPSVLLMLCAGFAALMWKRREDN